MGCYSVSNSARGTRLAALAVLERWMPFQHLVLRKNGPWRWMKKVFVLDSVYYGGKLRTDILYIISWAHIKRVTCEFSRHVLVHRDRSIISIIIKQGCHVLLIMQRYFFFFFLPACFWGDYRIEAWVSEEVTLWVLFLPFQYPPHGGGCGNGGNNTVPSKNCCFKTP